MNNNLQTSVRQNSTPQGGATNYITQGNGFVTLDMFSLKALNDRFSNSTTANMTKQGTTPLKQGQLSDFQMQNVGFAQAYHLDFFFDIIIKGGTGVDNTLQVDRSFPYSLVPQIQHILNGNITTHSGSAYELATVYNRKYGNVYTNEPISQATDGSTKMDFSQYHDTVIGLGLNSSLFEIIDVTGGSIVFDPKSGKISAFVKAAAATDLRIKLKFVVTLEHTVRKDNLVGILPLQNNSVYSNVRVTVSNLLSANFKTVFNTSSATGAFTAELNEATSYVQPTVNAYAVPDPSMINTYAFLTSYNYYNLSTTYQTQATGQQAFQYKLSNNYMLMSLVIALNNTNTGKTVPAKTIDNMYVNYNNSYILDNISTDLRNYINSMSSTNCKNPAQFGQFLLDFANWNMAVNGENTSRYLNLYNANNLTLTGDIDSAFGANGLSCRVMAEYLVPTATNVLAG